MDRYRSTDSLSFVTLANFPRAMTVRRMANDVTYTKYAALPSITCIYVQTNKCTVQRSKPSRVALSVRVSLTGSEPEVSWPKVWNQTCKFCSFRDESVSLSTESAPPAHTTTNRFVNNNIRKCKHGCCQGYLHDDDEKVGPYLWVWSSDGLCIEFRIS